MPWRPSQEQSNSYERTTSFWQAFEYIYDNAHPTESLRRGDAEQFRYNYITERYGAEHQDIKTLCSFLPARFRRERLGPTEIDIIKFFYRAEADRLLFLEGPRGAGKTSLIHYVELLLNRNRDPDTPFLVILNANVYPHEENVDERRLEQVVIQDIARELHKICEQPWHSSELATKMQELADGLETTPTKDALIDAFLGLNDAIYGFDPRKFFLVFDNLDPLSKGHISSIFRIAWTLYTSTSIGTILSLRSANLRGMMDSGAVRFFVNTRIPVMPPSIRAWRIHFPERMTQAFRRIRANERPGIRGKPPTIKRFSLAMLRLMKLTEGRFPEDDPTDLMQAVSASDIRKLILLFRRLLQNEKIPTDWLFSDQSSSDDSNPPDFHPLTALLQGAHPLFVSESLIVNLLSVEVGQTVHNSLIQHRVLSLLAQGKYWEVWNENLRDMLVANQKKDGPTSGSWDPTDAYERTGGRIYSTSL